MANQKDKQITIVYKAFLANHFLTKIMVFGVTLIRSAITSVIGVGNTTGKWKDHRLFSGQ